MLRNGNGKMYNMLGMFVHIFQFVCDALCSLYADGRRQNDPSKTYLEYITYMLILKGACDALRCGNITR